MSKNINKIKSREMLLIYLVQLLIFIISRSSRAFYHFLIKIKQITIVSFIWQQPKLSMFLQNILLLNRILIRDLVLLNLLLLKRMI